MPVNDVLAQLHQLLRRTTPLVEGAERLPETFLKLTPGQQVRATVLSQLPSGRFLVQVNDQHLDLNLPRDTQPGSQVELRYVGSQPRLTFMLAGEPVAPSRSPVNLSDTARYIGALLARASNLTSQGAAPTAANPVLEAPPSDPQKLAVALKTALAESGLFYESHQAQWVAGERSLAALLREPQGQLSQPRAFAAAHGEAARPAPAADDGEPARPAAPPLPDNGSGPARAAEGLSAPREPVHPQAAPLVQQQLEALDTRQLIWQGEVWPGQTLRWEIEEREGGGEGAPAERQWVTRLALTLPSLGGVEARLRLDALGVHVDLSVGEDQARAALEAGAQALAEGFERAGLRLAEFQVRDHG